MEKERENMVISKFPIHEVARCRTCDKEWDGLDQARKAAYAHAKKTGHKVHVEAATVTIYNDDE